MVPSFGIPWPTKPTVSVSCEVEMFRGKKYLYHMCQHGHKNFSPTQVSSKCPSPKISLLLFVDFSKYLAYLNSPQIKQK